MRSQCDRSQSANRKEACEVVIGPIFFYVNKSMFFTQLVRLRHTCCIDCNTCSDP